MNIIDHSSDNIRQIVPQDLSFLSDADQQICSAIHSILAALLGGTGTEPIAISGCEITDRDTGLTLSVAHRYTISQGLVLINGKIYEFLGGNYQSGTTNNTSIPSIGAAAVITNTTYTPYIILDDQPVTPSPVYGESLQLDQYPHRRLTASLFQEIATTTNGTTTYPNGQAPAGSISLSSLKRIPALGQFC